MLVIQENISVTLSPDWMARQPRILRSTRPLMPPRPGWTLTEPGFTFGVGRAWVQKVIEQMPLSSLVVLFFVSHRRLPVKLLVVGLRSVGPFGADGVEVWSTMLRSRSWS